MAAHRRGSAGRSNACGFASPSGRRCWCLARLRGAGNPLENRSENVGRTWKIAWNTWNIPWNVILFDDVRWKIPWNIILFDDVRWNIWNIILFDDVRWKIPWNIILFDDVRYWLVLYLPL